MQKYEPPSGDLAEQTEKDFGSLDKLVADFNPKTVAIQVLIVPPSGTPCPTSHRYTHAAHREVCRVQPHFAGLLRALFLLLWGRPPLIGHACLCMLLIGVPTHLPAWLQCVPGSLLQVLVAFMEHRSCTRV